MSFPKSFLEELKARVRVSDVVGRKVKLVRRGREWVGLSPFTHEKTPSFTVNDEKQFYHCFSSSEHGDVIKFLEKTENLSFLEAVERLAGEAGLEMPQRTPADAERERKRAGLGDVMAMAAEFFRAQLKAGAGAEARAYLERRGLTAEIIDRFELGFGPDSRTALRDYLGGRGIAVSQMIEAGLLIGGDDIPEPYDRFRNRVMFPIEDARGRVIAFGGRALDPNARAKYLNSPETPLFHKGHVLYNLARARKAAHEVQSVIVVEGYMDVIALAQAGFVHAVAPLGTALTEDQIALLWRLAPEPVLCFDGDKAGLKAAFRATERVLPLLKPGHSLRFAVLPEGKDPDDLVREEGSPAFQALLDRAAALSDMVWDKETQEGRWDTPERRAMLEARIDEVVRHIGETKVRAHYDQLFRTRIQRLFETAGPVLRGSGRAVGGQGRGRERRPGTDWRGGQGGWGRGSFGAGRMAGPTPQLRRSALGQGGDGTSAREALIVLTILNHPDLLDAHCEMFAQLDFQLPELDKLRNEIIDIAALHAPLDRRGLKDHLEIKGLADTARRLTERTGLRNEFFAWPEADHEAAERGWLHVVDRHRKALTLRSELKAAEQALAREMTDENMARLQALHAQIDRVEI